MRIRAAVLEETGGKLAVQGLELAPPGPEEVLVRLEASGVCYSDLNAIDGTAETLCPAVLGHEGAGVVEPVYHYSFLSTFAEACVVPERSCVPIPHDVPFEIAGLVGCAVTTGVGAVWRTAQTRPGDRVAVIGCGGVGLSALMAAVAVGADHVIAVDAVPAKLEAARSFGATSTILWQGSPEATAEAVREASDGGVDVAVEATGRTEAMLAAYLCTRPRGAAVLVGIPREDAVLQLPAATIPRGERRVLGSIYGSSKPERDFGFTLSLYRAGRLPLDRLISHRLPLDDVEHAFALMKNGDALRVILDLSGA